MIGLEQWPRAMVHFAGSTHIGRGIATQRAAILRGAFGAATEQEEFWVNGPETSSEHS